MYNNVRAGFVCMCVFVFMCMFAIVLVNIRVSYMYMYVCCVYVHVDPEVQFQRSHYSLRYPHSSLIVCLTYYNTVEGVFVQFDSEVLIRGTFSITITCMCNDNNCEYGISLYTVYFREFYLYIHIHVHVHAHPGVFPLHHLFRWDFFSSGKFQFHEIIQELLPEHHPPSLRARPSH